MEDKVSRPGSRYLDRRPGIRYQSLVLLVETIDRHAIRSGVHRQHPASSRVESRTVRMAPTYPSRIGWFFDLNVCCRAKAAVRRDGKYRDAAMLVIGDDERFAIRRDRELARISTAAQLPVKQGRQLSVPDKLVGYYRSLRLAAGEPRFVDRE